MRIHNFLLIICFLLIVPQFSYSQKKKTDEEVATATEPVFVEGIVYALPRTGLSIHVKAQKASFVPGPYAAYAEKYLGLKNVNTSAGTSWKISSIKVNTFSEADPNAVFKTASLPMAQISVLSNGVIAGIKTDGIMEPNQIVEDDAIVDSPSLPEFTDLSSDEYYITAVNPETGAESISYKNMEDKAREAADYIFRLRKKRSFTILSPSDVVPEDGKGYEVFVNEAQRLEKEYISLFTGKSVQSEHEFSFTFVPEGNDLKNEIIFRFSEDKGVVSKSDISGKPVMISITGDAGYLKTLNQLKKSDNPKAGKSGIYYRIPVMADLSITDGLTTLYSGRTELPQFGVVAPMPESLLDGNQSIKYNITSGTILQIGHSK